MEMNILFTYLDSSGNVKRLAKPLQPPTVNWLYKTNVVTVAYAGSSFMRQAKFFEPKFSGTVWKCGINIAIALKPNCESVCTNMFIKMFELRKNIV